MEDTYKGQVDNPLSLNRYTYVHNNPLRFVDVDGHRPVDVGSVGGGGAAPGGTALEPVADFIEEWTPIGTFTTLKDLNSSGAEKGFAILGITPMGKGAKIVMNGIEYVSDGTKWFIKGTGDYNKVGGHHVHAKAAFKQHVSYDAKKGFSISQDYMKEYGLDHQLITNKQRELFKELYNSGRPNTLVEHTRIAVEALVAGGASEKLARKLVAESLKNLREQGVREVTNIPWYK